MNLNSKSMNPAISPFALRNNKAAYSVRRTSPRSVKPIGALEHWLATITAATRNCQALSVEGAFLIVSTLQDPCENNLLSFARNRYAPVFMVCFSLFSPLPTHTLSFLQGF